MRVFTVDAMQFTKAGPDAPDLRRIVAWRSAEHPDVFAAAGGHCRQRCQRESL